MKKYQLVKGFSLLFAAFMNSGLPVNGMFNMDPDPIFNDMLNRSTDSELLFNGVFNILENERNSDCVRNVELLKSFLKGKENVFIVPIDESKSYGVVVR